jgi:ubiquinone/menaquinone biosynthesis C-methylase UbiE
MRMDDYTKTTREWLDGRFRNVDENGIYVSHAPIYGFKDDIYAFGIYRNCFAILREIELITRRHVIESFLEVGCAEGFTAHLVRELFGFRTTVADLSGEAVKRAKEIYGMDGFAADVQSLDGLKDGSFDLVLCSETIEHVPNPEKALAELIRVAGKALVITVPAAANEREKRNYKIPALPHTHLNIFTKNELERAGGAVKVKKIELRWITRVELLLMKQPFKFFYGPRTAKFLLRLDSLLCRVSPGAAFTYLAVYDKAPAGGALKTTKKRDILSYMLEGGRVKPHHL